MKNKSFPIIDPIATGENILRLRKERNLTVRDLQSYFGFEEPQAIYKWQQGKSLPSVDNLYALGALFEIPLEEILVSQNKEIRIAVSTATNMVKHKRQENTLPLAHFKNYYSSPRRYGAYYDVPYGHHTHFQIACNTAMRKLRVTHLSTTNRSHGFRHIHLYA